MEKKKCESDNSPKQISLRDAAQREQDLASMRSSLLHALSTGSEIPYKESDVVKELRQKAAESAVVVNAARAAKKEQEDKMQKNPDIKANDYCFVGRESRSESNALTKVDLIDVVAYGQISKDSDVSTFFSSLPQWNIVAKFVNSRPDCGGAEYQIIGRAFHELASERYLFGDSIDAGLELVVQRASSSNHVFKEENKIASVALPLSMTFIDSIGSGVGEIFDYDGLLGKRAKIPDLDTREKVLKCKFIYFPFNVPGLHYLLLRANFVSGTIDVYDSLPNCTGRERISQYILFVERYIESLYAEVQLPCPKLYANVVDTPRQNNGIDCGLHVIWNALALSLNRDLTALPASSAISRLRFGQSLIIGSIIPFMEG